MEIVNDFHFLRPLWLLALLPLLWLAYLLWKKPLGNTGFEHLIDKKLLSHLTATKERHHSRLPFIFLICSSLIAIIALAGPVWKKIPQPLLSTESAVVIVLDLSPSMRAEDLKPSRIVRAHLKIQDFLSRRKDGLTALVVYAGEAHIVTPLTDDTKTISNLLPTLEPGILPLPGSNTEMGIAIATELVRAASLPAASILLISDGIDASAEKTIKKQLPPSISLSILGLGTEEGAPIPSNGDFLKDSSGKLIVAKRNSATMQALAKAVDGYYLPIQADTNDIDFYYQQLEQQFGETETLDKQEREFDLWHEFGPTLLVLFIPLIALLFRRGLVLGLFPILISLGSLSPSTAHAALWDYLWKNNEQRAAEDYQREEYDKAAKNFDNPQWKGSAHYQDNNYNEALSEFSKDPSAIGDYNRGNALAQLQRLDDAIAAYDAALAKKPDFEQAQRNKKLLEELKKNQEQQNQSGQDQQEQSQNQQNSDQQNSNQQNSDKSSEQNKQSSKQDDNQQNTEDKNSQENKNGENKQNQSADKERSEAETLGEESRKDANEDGPSTATEQELSAEQQQALEQWLRKVPDDPSGLLKRKFEYEYQKRRQLYQQGEWQLPENNAHQRY